MIEENDSNTSTDNVEEKDSDTPTTNEDDADSEPSNDNLSNQDSETPIDSSAKTISGNGNDAAMVKMKVRKLPPLSLQLLSAF